MKAFIDMLADVRLSGQEVATELMKEQADVQEAFLMLCVYYIAAMSQRRIYSEEVAHIVRWSERAMKALDGIGEIR
jgi:hypothetical protein